MVIIAGIFCIGSASFTYITFLNAARTPEPWKATIICIIITCIILCYVRVKKIRSKALTIGMIICLGIAQMMILKKAKTPYSYFWEYREGSDIVSQLWAAIFSQPVIWLIGYIVSTPLVICLETKARKLVDKIIRQLKNQIDALQDIAHEITNLNGSYKASDDLVSLLSIITDNTLENAYISARTKKDANVLASIADISSRCCLNINTKGKTLSTINIDVTNKIQDKTKLLEEITKRTFSRKDCRYLKKKLKMIKKKC